jgi:hypothetical protein
LKRERNRIGARRWCERRLKKIDSLYNQVQEARKQNENEQKNFDQLKIKIFELENIHNIILILINKIIFEFDPIIFLSILYYFSRGLH